MTCELGDDSGVAVQFGEEVLDSLRCGEGLFVRISPVNVGSPMRAEVKLYDTPWSTLPAGRPLSEEFA